MKRILVALALFALPAPASAQIVINPTNVPPVTVGQAIVKTADSPETWGGASVLTLPLTDNVPHFKNSADATKLLQFLLTNVSTGNTRQITVPDCNVDLSATTANRVLATGGAGAGCVSLRALVAADIPSIDGSKIIGAASLADAVLSSNVARKNASNVFTTKQVASAAVPGDTIADLSNTSAAGYGLYVRGGTTGNYSLRVVDYAGTTQHLDLTAGVLTVAGGITTGDSTSTFAKTTSDTPGTGVLKLANAGVNRVWAQRLDTVYGLHFDYYNGASWTDVLSLSTAGDVRLAATKKFYFDGGSDTYVVESSANVLSFYTGGTIQMDIYGGEVYSAGSIFRSGSTTPFRGANATATTGTAVIWDAGGYYRPQTSSARYKEHIEPWVVDRDALDRFVALSPMSWDYKGQRNGAAGFISEDLDGLGILNRYGRSPLVNYNAQGQPESNRDFGLIALQHLVLQDHDAQLKALAARVAALEAK